MTQTRAKKGKWFPLKPGVERLDDPIRGARAQSDQTPLHAALTELSNSARASAAVIPPVHRFRRWAGGMTLCSATSTVFSPKSVIQPRKQVALCALQPAGRGASALTPGTPLVLTYLQALKCVCPCAGRNRLCSSHFARRESLLSSCSLSSVSPRSSWICVYLCPFCTESPPTSPAGGAFGSLHPRREPTGLFMPCAFPVDSKTREIKRCARG